MTPAVENLKAQGIAFELLRFRAKVQPDLALTVAGELGVDHRQVFKTLITQADAGDLFVALVPAAAELDLKKLAAATGVRKMKMAEQKTAERSSGYLKGAISPIAQKNPLPTYLDESARQFSQVYVSGGKRGLELQLSVADLCAACSAEMIPLVAGQG